MPYGLDAHVLTVDANVLHKVDTGNLDNLFSMWAVFNKCADSVEQGRRLENLSWRLWQREQFCCDEKPCLDSTTSSPASQTPRSIPSSSHIPDDVPRLSSSVDSNDDDTAVEFSAVSMPLDFPRPMIRRQDSSTSTRSRRERHITADDFEKMVSSIINTKEPVPLSAPEPVRPIASRQSPVPATKPTPVTSTSMAAAPIKSTTTTTTTTTTITASSMLSVKSETSRSPDLSLPHMTPNTQIVHGFSPSQVHVAISPPAPEPVSATISEIPGPDAAPSKEVLPKKQAKFALGGSCSSSEPDSLRPSAVSRPPSNHSNPSMRKQTSFAQTLAAYNPNEAAIDSDSEDDDVDDDDDDDLDESAIEEDDESSEWEDSVEEHSKSIDETVFKRDNSKVHLPLTSHPSLITLMIENKDRDYIASHSTTALHRLRSSTSTPAKVLPSTSPHDSDDAGLHMKRAARSSNLNPIRESAARTKAQPIVAPHHHNLAPGCLSPRTTRNHMVQAELTASLRVGIVHARKQNGLALQRRHTSHDVTTIKQLAEKKPCMKPDNENNPSSLSRYYLPDTANGYHDRGW